MTVVLDASALLALLFREPGSEAVARVMNAGGISTVNACEVLARFARDGHDPTVVLQQLMHSSLQLLEFTPTHAATAARLAPLVRARELSLGDRACLALGIECGLPAMTADPARQDLDVGGDVRLIR